MRDLLDAPEPEWRAERAKVRDRGLGRQAALACQDEDGQWAGGAFLPRDFDPREWQEVGQPWTATTFSLSQLREFGLDPASDRARRTVELIGANSRWEHDGQPYWEGEVEECINGRTVADGAYFGVDVSPIVDRLVGERLDDGGWNCERANGSRPLVVRTARSTCWKGCWSTREPPAARPSRERRAVGRGVSAGAQPLPPAQHRRAGRRAIPAVPASEPMALRRPARARLFPLRRIADRRRARSAARARRSTTFGPGACEDGTLAARLALPGRVWFEVDDGQGKPSRWVTLRAMRVLRWWDGASRVRWRSPPASGTGLPAMSHPAGALAWAQAQVAAVRDDPAGASRADGAGVPRADGQRAATPTVPARGAVVHALAGAPRRPRPDWTRRRPGSVWWRAVNERLLRDGCETIALLGGSAGEPSSPAVRLWLDFGARPTGRNWYRAHNASVVAGYLEHRGLAEAEREPERFFMNVALVRVLYAHALGAAPAPGARAVRSARPGARRPSPRDGRRVPVTPPRAARSLSAPARRRSLHRRRAATRPACSTTR